MQTGDLRQLPSTFHVAGRPSFNFHQFSVLSVDLSSTSITFLCNLETFRKLPSTFHSTGRSSVNFRQHSVWPGGLLSTTVKFLCGQKPFVNLRQKFVWPRDLLSTSVNIPLCRGTYCQISPIFRAAGIPAINYRQSSVHWETFCHLP